MLAKKVIWAFPEHLMENHNELFWLTQYFEEPGSHIVLTDTVQRGTRWSNWNVFYLEGIFRLPKFWFVGFYHSSNQSVSNTSVLKQLPGGQTCRTECFPGTGHVGPLSK